MDGANQTLVPDWLMEQIFPEDSEIGEEPLHIDKCKKISRWGIGQDRVVVLSTHCVYILSTKDVSKKVPIEELKYIIKSTMSKELLLYFDTDFDMRLICETRDEMLDLLKLRFAKFCPKKHLKVYGIPEESLKKYKASKQRGSSYAFDCEPESKFRLRKEEIQTQRQVDEEKKKNETTGNIDEIDIEIDPNDFEFGGRESIKVVSKKAKPGIGKEMPMSKGDRSSDFQPSDENLLDESLIELDNLAENFMDLELTDGGNPNA